MPRSELVRLMSSYQKAQFLKRIKAGDSVGEWLLEGLQDAGLIDHNNNLTEPGEKILSQANQLDVEDGIAGA